MSPTAAKLAVKMLAHLPERLHKVRDIHKGLPSLPLEDSKGLPSNPLNDYKGLPSLPLNNYKGLPSLLFTRQVSVTSNKPMRDEPMFQGSASLPFDSSRLRTTARPSPAVLSQIYMVNPPWMS